jgi:hypothetical protein
VKRTVKHAHAIENSSRRSLLLAALLLLALAPAARAATLDTPALLSLGSGNFVCNFTNLDAAKTAILNASGTSGLIEDDGVVLQGFPTSLSVPPGQTATTFRTGCSRSASPLVFAPACHCHFDFTGVSKSKVRAALSTDDTGSVTAY